MYTVENQKVILVKKIVGDKKRLYAAIDLDAMENAVKNLKPASFTLWLYIDKNKNDWQFGLSRRAFCDWSGYSRNSFHGAVSELCEKKFLVPKEDGSNVYIFYEKPEEQPKETEEMTIEYAQNDKDVDSDYNF